MMNQQNLNEGFLGYTKEEIKEFKDFEGEFEEDNYYA